MRVKTQEALSGGAIILLEDREGNDIADDQRPKSVQGLGVKNFQWTNEKPENNLNVFSKRSHLRKH